MAQLEHFKNPEFWVSGSDEFLDQTKGTLYGPAEYLTTERQKQLRFMNREEYIHYTKKVEQSDGFDVDGCTGRLSGGIVPVSRNLWPLADLAARFAARSQKEEEGGIPIEFVRLVKANFQPVSGILYYLTFTGIDTTQQVEKTYRAKVWVKPGRENFLLMFEEVADDSTTVTRKKFVADDRRGEEIKGKKKGKKKRKSRVWGKRKAKKVYRWIPDGSSCFFNLPGGIGIRAWHIIVNELRSEDPNLTYAEARQAASVKWKNISLEERRLYVNKVKYGSKKS